MWAELSEVGEHIGSKILANGNFRAQTAASDDEMEALP